MGWFSKDKLRLEDVANDLMMQAKHLTNIMAKLEEAHARNTADIAEIDRMLAASLQSQNRYDEQLSASREIMYDLADKHLKNEMRFAELVEARRVNEMRLDKMEASYEPLEQFVRDFREETRTRQQETDNRFAETAKRLAELAVAQAETDRRVADFVRETNGRSTETDKRMAEFVSETNGRFVETDKRLAELASAQTETGKRMAEFISEANGRFAETDKRLAELAVAQAKTDEQMKRADERMNRTDEQIKAIVTAQARTEEQIKALVDRNGAKKPRRKSTKAAKKMTRKAKRN